MGKEMAHQNTEFGLITEMQNDLHKKKKEKENKMKKKRKARASYKSPAFWSLHKGISMTAS